MSIPCISLHNLDGSDAFISISEAARKGIFYCEYQNDFQNLIDEALQFCYRFPIDEELKKFTDGKFGGYHPRPHDQIESFYVEKRDWEKILSINLQVLCYKMNAIAKTLLKAILKNSGIPKELWNSGTGKITEEKGQNYFSFNHYNPLKSSVGLKAHRDFGFVSILFVEKQGLEVLVQDVWEKVSPLKNHFVVILGKAFEILVNDTLKVTAARHQVRQLSEERASFGITCDNETDSPVLKYVGENKMEMVHPNYNNYLKECFKELYK